MRFRKGKSPLLTNIVFFRLKVLVKVDIEASGRDKFEIGTYSLALHSTSFKGCYESHMVRAYGTFKAQLNLYCVVLIKTSQKIK